MSISTIVLAITDVFGRGGGARGSPSKDEGVLKKLLDSQERLLRHCLPSWEVLLGPFKVF